MSAAAEVAAAAVCVTAVGCTGECRSTGKSCTRYGQAFTSLLVLDYWFGRDRRRKTLWRAVRGAWVEVATSTSTRLLVNAFSMGTHVVMPAGVEPTVPAPLEPAPGTLF